MDPTARKLPVAGVLISTTSYEEATRRTAELVAAHRAAAARGERPRARYVAVTSVHGVVSAQRDERLRRIINQAEMAVPDGMPVVWALRSFGARGQQRVYGPTLMLHLCRQAAREGHRIFLYGARPETLEALESRLKRKFPGLKIVGKHSPPFRPLTADEDAAVCEQILGSRADLVFVGISTPKQELWMAEHVDKLPGVVMFGVGAAFDFHAGQLRQAPAWMQRNGLEWLFRLIMEPRRLWRRYLFETPRFLPLWARQWASMLFNGADRGAGVGSGDTAVRSHHV